ncbi:MAG: dicarboxylate/amino acid:cation symporter [Sphingosinicella sp.]
MSQTVRILLALFLGLGLGIVALAIGGDWVDRAAAIAEPIGGLWVSALRMTIIPLIVGLLVTGIADAAEAARAGRLARNAIITFLVLLWISAIVAALMTPALLGAFPMPSGASDALQGALGASEPVREVPGFADFLRAIVPDNPIAAAAEDAILPLMLFTLLFAFALTRLPEGPRERLVGVFRSLADVMLVMIGWILWIAPIGVFALAFAVGARAGGAAFGALIHYVLIVSAVGAVLWLAAWPLARIGADIPLLRFTQAIAPSQAVAFSTQSSLASLPAMLRGAAELKVPVAASGVLLPMAVAIFRATGPAMNLAVAIYIAHWFGIALTPAVLAMGVAAAATTTLGAAGIPGQATFVTSIAPICLAMGVPIEPLALLIAVEILPDLMRTLGNVSMDVAVTATVARRSGYREDGDTTEDRLLEQGA